MARVLAVDYGDTRIGTALSDPMRIIARGFKTVMNDVESCKTIAAICIEQDVDTVVLGMPYNREGKIGFAAAKVVNFARSLYSEFEDAGLKIPLYTVDEAYSTVEADTILKNRKKTKKKRTEVIDQLAAAAILTQFLSEKNPAVFPL
jgi:putative Holliday junction resolvase